MSSLLFWGNPMSQINVWIALREDAHADMDARLKHDEERDGGYNGPITSELAKTFQSMQDRSVIQSLFRQDPFGVRVWTLYSLYFEDDEVMLGVAKLRQEFTNRLKVIGAWDWECVPKHEA